MVWEHPVVLGDKWRGSWPKPRSPFLVQAGEARLGWCTICWTQARSGRLHKRFVWGYQGDAPVKTLEEDLGRSVCQVG